MVLSFNGQWHAQPFPSSAVVLLPWVVCGYEMRCMCIIGNDAAGHQGAIGIAEGAQGNCLCAFKAWLMCAICRVGIEGSGCLSHGEEGKGLQRQG